MCIKQNDKVKIIGGNNEIGQLTMIGKVGIVLNFGTKYMVKGRSTKEVYVNIDSETHVFNDYHLENNICNVEMSKKEYNKKLKELKI